MKTLYLILCFTLLADALPRKTTPHELRALWVDSPFTTKPPPEAVEKKMGQWSLAGIMNHSDGNYTVTIINKKDRSDRRRINTDGSNMLEKEREISIVEVEQAEGFDYRKSRVKISENGEDGWVEYDQSLLAVKKSIPNVRPQNNLPPRNISTRNNSSPRNNSSNQNTNSTSRRPSNRNVSSTPPGMNTNSTQLRTNSSNSRSGAAIFSRNRNSAGGTNQNTGFSGNTSSSNNTSTGYTGNTSTTTNNSSSGVITNQNNSVSQNNTGTNTTTTSNTNDTVTNTEDTTTPVRRPVIRRIPISR